MAPCWRQRPSGSSFNRRRPCLHRSRSAIARIRSSRGFVAGDIPGVVAQTPEPFRAAIAELSRFSFATGFTLVLLVAGAVAALAAGLTFAFVSPVETAPVRLRAAPETATPDLLD